MLCNYAYVTKTTIDLFQALLIAMHFGPLLFGYPVETL